MSDKELLLRELSKIAAALGKTFAPYCEVIVSDLTDPDHVVTQIENSMSGREVGDPASLIGLARMADPEFPDIMTNFADAFRDGRPVKSTSIGLKDKSGRYVAALYLNIDISYIQSITTYLNQLIRTDDAPSSLYEAVSRTSTGADVYSKVATFAASRNREPRALTTDEKRELLRMLEDEGELDRRGAAEKIASILGVTRTQVYYYLRKTKKSKS
ncbi:MAG TPA: PAS domain-containing protein [Hyphomonas sp.]|nr:PAS domain-containing protein [Hyphomonas sp.]